VPGAPPGPNPPPWPPHDGRYATSRPEPRRRSLRWLVVGLVAAVVFSGGASAGVVIAHGVSRTASAAGAGSGSVGGIPPAAGGTTTPLPGSSVDPAAVAAVVDPAVVDINTTLGLQQASAAGTGIVLTSSGEVLTNNHVITGATSITATDVGTGRSYSATVVGYDISRDLAVLQLQGAANLPTASIGDSSTLAVGDSVVAVGNAGGRGGTPTAVAGTVTALDQTITASDPGGANTEELSGLIQVAADIQPGDSGGPLVDTAGHVVGVDTAATAGFRFQAAGGQGFAIPIAQAIAVADQIETGQASATVHIGATAFLGVSVTAAGSDPTASSGGAAVAGVVAGSPAETAGMAVGDVIVAVDQATVDAPSTLTTLLISHHPGDRVTIKLISRGGSARTLTLRLGTGPAA
jgi:S1-C subfamily serine protease